MRTALFVFSIAACTVQAETAWAEDSAKEATPGIIYDWSGIYIGGHIGRGWSGADTVLNGSEDLVDLYEYYGVEMARTHDLDGWLAGGHVGLQRQFGRLVLGLEASLTGVASGFDGKSSHDFDGIAGLPPLLGAWWEGTSSFKTEFKNRFTLTGRVGYAWDRWLGYLKGGYASAKVRLTHTLEGEGEFCIFGECVPASPNLAFSSTEHHGGWVVGSGFEYMIRPSVVLGLEYNYIDLRARTHKRFGRGDLYEYLLGRADLNLNYPIDTTVRVDPDPIHSVYVRLSFKLGPELSSH